MTICANRTDDPGMFTSCFQALGNRACACSREVSADLAAAALGEPAAVPRYVPWTCAGCGLTGQARPSFNVRCTCGVLTRSTDLEETR